MGESLKFNFGAYLYFSIFTDEIWYEAVIGQNTTELIENTIIYQIECTERESNIHCSICCIFSVTFAASGDICCSVVCNISCTQATFTACADVTFVASQAHLLHDPVTSAAHGCDMCCIKCSKRHLQALDPLQRPRCFGFLFWQQHSSVSNMRK